MSQSQETAVPTSAGLSRDISWMSPGRRAVLSLSDQIASELSERIIRGEYAPGERLLEQQISSEFAVSRNPVREALRILERDGFLEIVPRRGAQVLDLGETEIQETFEILEKLFELMSAHLARKSNRRVIDTLSRAVDQLESYMQHGIPSEHHVLLVHRLAVHLSELSGNRSLYQIVSRLMIRSIGFIRKSLQTQARRRQSIENWTLLRDAIVRGDVAAAEHAGSKMVRETVQTLSRQPRRRVQTGDANAVTA